ncbi:MAG: hypothetical protein GY795_45030 [Desulfobacterales bacterium]|nr:hypothetical protein [Desulfobacterales bacterium]
MRKITKITAFTILTAFLIAGSAFGVSFSDNVTGIALTEPITLILLGFGLIGLAGVIKSVFGVTEE